jgi:hypothetical protein
MIANRRNILFDENVPDFFIAPAPQTRELR